MDDSSEPEENTSVEFAVGERVLIHGGTEHEQAGVVVEDFGTHAGYAVDIGDDHIVDAGRRWAIATDDGALAFHDTPDLIPDE